MCPVDGAGPARPRHVALIMDGNGRWAERRGLSRSAGHREGARRIMEILTEAAALGIRTVSLYVFSTENWKRERREVRGIFRLLGLFFEDALDRMLALGIRAEVTGDRSGLPQSAREAIERLVERTRHGRRLTVFFCVNYGGQAELRRACRLWATRCSAGGLGAPEPTEAEMQDLLWSEQMPPVDLLIRTGGDRRLSNFLLYQSAYAELLFVRRPWPAFRARDLNRAVRAFTTRVRTRGGQRQAVQPSAGTL